MRHAMILAVVMGVLASGANAQSPLLRDVCEAQAAAASGYTPGRAGVARLRITGSASFGASHSTRPRLPSPAFAGGGAEEMRAQRAKRTYDAALARCLGQ